MSNSEFLETLQSIIVDRLQNPTETSYTARLASAGALKVAQKFGEESIELTLASVAESDGRVTDEAADVIYHLLVLLSLRGIGLAEVVEELQRRHQHAESRS